MKQRDPAVEGGDYPSLWGRKETCGFLMPTKESGRCCVLMQRPFNASRATFVSRGLQKMQREQNLQRGFSSNRIT